MPMAAPAVTRDVGTRAQDPTPNCGGRSAIEPAEEHDATRRSFCARVRRGQAQTLRSSSWVTSTWQCHSKDRACPSTAE
eukprot:3460925-Pyramimonas_sp.AAC.1